jgi:predicted metalloprotease with PDZ domain
MTKYHIKTGPASQHVLLISYTFSAPSNNPLLQIPFWRPGRYEAGNFASNFRSIRVFIEGEEIPARKVSSHVVEVDAAKGSIIECQYECYAARLTAGNTYYDEEVLLINPVNSLLYAQGLEEEEIEVRLDHPNGFELASGFLKKKIDRGHALFYASDIQHLMDTPILGSVNMKRMSYHECGVDFTIHIAGEDHPDEKGLLYDFKSFSRAQLQAFGSLPVKEYHFLILLLPYRAYHGVEHENSTVIIFGDAISLSERANYLNLLGVSSHELYHTWNVKSLRPAEWCPYDFTAESPSRLGYVAEGVTTYLGDWMLWHCGILSDEEYLKELAKFWRTHMLNEGRYALSLGDSSVDTWVDGYGTNIPRRRVSIYTEGAMLAIICDLRMLHASMGKKSINDFMKVMYTKYGKKRGYTESDYWREMEDFSGLDFSDLIRDVVNGRGHLESYFHEALDLIGVRIKEFDAPNELESRFGLKVAKMNGFWTIVNLMKDSPAERAGLWFGQRISNINRMEPPEDFANLELGDKVILTIIETGSEKEIEFELHATGDVWIRDYSLFLDAENDLFYRWKNAVLS